MCCVIFLLLNMSVVDSSIIKPRLYDGTVNQLGRYSFTFDAYDHISARDNPSVIAIGSSRMREIFDGGLIGNLSNAEYDFFNLAYGMDLPYIRMIEIHELIISSPGLVIIEIGPSTFSQLDPSVNHYNRTMQFMAHLMSMKPHIAEPEWFDIIDEKDEKYLPMNFQKQKVHWSSYGRESFEATIGYELFGNNQPFDCGPLIGHVRCVPFGIEEQEYEGYLRYPHQLPNVLASVKSTGTIINSNGNPYSMPLEKYYGTYLEKRLNHSYHNPEGNYNKNHAALDFILSNLIEHDVNVLLVGLPYNPVFLSRLAPGQWDYVNQSLALYNQNPHLHVVDYTWDTDWVDDDFSDLAHAARDGEILFAEKIVRTIDEILLFDGERQSE